MTNRTMFLILPLMFSLISPAVAATDSQQLVLG